MKTNLDKRIAAILHGCVIGGSATRAGDHRNRTAKLLVAVAVALALTLAAAACALASRPSVAPAAIAARAQQCAEPYPAQRNPANGWGSVEIRPVARTYAPGRGWYHP